MTMDPVASGLVAGGCLMGFALCLALQATLRRLQQSRPKPAPPDAIEYHRRGRFWVTRVGWTWLSCEDSQRPKGGTWVIGEHSLRLDAVRQCEQCAKREGGPA